MSNKKEELQTVTILYENQYHQLTLSDLSILDDYPQDFQDLNNINNSLNQDIECKYPKFEVVKCQDHYELRQNPQQNLNISNLKNQNIIHFSFQFKQIEKNELKTIMIYYVVLCYGQGFLQKKTIDKLKGYIEKIQIQEKNKKQILLYFWQHVLQFQFQEDMVQYLNKIPQKIKKYGCLYMADIIISNDQLQKSQIIYQIFKNLSLDFTELKEKTQNIIAGEITLQPIISQENESLLIIYIKNITQSLTQLPQKSETQKVSYQLHDINIGSKLFQYNEDWKFSILSKILFDFQQQYNQESNKGIIRHFFNKIRNNQNTKKDEKQFIENYQKLKDEKELDKKTSDYLSQSIFDYLDLKDIPTFQYINYNQAKQLIEVIQHKFNELKVRVNLRLFKISDHQNISRENNLDIVLFYTERKIVFQKFTIYCSQSPNKQQSPFKKFIILFLFIRQQQCEKQQMEVSTIQEDEEAKGKQEIKIMKTAQQSIQQPDLLKYKQDNQTYNTPQTNKTNNSVNQNQLQECVSEFQNVDENEGYNKFVNQPHTQQFNQSKNLAFNTQNSMNSSNLTSLQHDQQLGTNQSESQKKQNQSFANFSYYTPPSITQQFNQNTNIEINTQNGMSLSNLRSQSFQHNQQLGINQSELQKNQNQSFSSTIQITPLSQTQQFNQNKNIDLNTQNGMSSSNLKSQSFQHNQQLDTNQSELQKNQNQNFASTIYKTPPSKNQQSDSQIRTNQKQSGLQDNKKETSSLSYQMDQQIEDKLKQCKVIQICQSCNKNERQIFITKDILCNTCFQRKASKYL
ncbi:hypothetical protein TTHERM_000756339 (macronuclear) [Tetrahymena thermophila SB210]|uniref:Uncharacterized protein n=1 Tax=Tetrahymena thermophila (strain SB210) TaxID=312017 RepID=W7XD27_TETTS|nr:hypothetical protein TTHERM_000756339 [Tetrahymena thermophila SB210]EWS71716.1 hypothetical protein TTHERM_000756339 [Tetrahymena thermophila SB210]|eukprot:XP_012655757.1 hypothetical protein TTHERM_000756339 [Tetrahymena thermophila SB210]